MKRILRVGAWMLLAIPLALSSLMARAESLPVPGKLDERIRTAFYNPAQVYRLYGFVGYAVELIFEPGETVAGEGGGDLDGITFGAHSNHLILKPKAANVGTNLVVYTNRRAYRFQYSAVARAPDSGTDQIMYAVRFLYPPAPSAPAAAASIASAAVQRDLARAAHAPPTNLNYWYCGAPALKPVAASDDGVQTRITFGARTQLPAIFVLNADGAESLINFHMDAGTLVIHRVAARFILRRGKLTGCIVNKSFSGGGERLSSGTIAPDVERERRGVQP